MAETVIALRGDGRCGGRTPKRRPYDDVATGRERCRHLSFDLVYNNLIASIVSDVPLDADDLPGYAGLLFDQSIAHPDMIRLTLWDRLERGGQGARQPAVVEANLAKVAAIQRAQEAGRIASRMAAADLLLLVTTTAGMWSFAQMGPDGSGNEVAAAARATLVQAIRLIVDSPV